MKNLFVICMFFVPSFFYLHGMDRYSTSSESLLHQTCAICNKKNLLGNVVFCQLSCGHFVHFDCWSGHAGDCPVCDMSVFKTGEFGLINVPLKEEESKPKKRCCCFCPKSKK